MGPGVALEGDRTRAFGDVVEGSQRGDLEEGIAARPLDVDVIWIYGYGFPVYRGGVLFWADSVGLKTIYDKVSQIHQETGSDTWKPAALLEKLAKEGKGFYS